MLGFECSEPLGAEQGTRGTTRPARSWDFFIASGAGQPLEHRAELHLHSIEQLSTALEGHRVMMLDRSKPDPHQDDPEPTSVPPRQDLESTAALLAAIKAGHDGARERLVARYLPILLRWAHGRLPRSARDLAETEDLVHVGLLKALAHVGTFEYQREGAFFAYLRQILRNEIRMEIRRTSRHPTRQSLAENLPVRSPSPLEEAVGNEALRAYEAGLAALHEDEREAVILRLEFGLKHEQVATVLGKPSADAARMLVARALVRLTAAMEI